VKEKDVFTPGGKTWLKQRHAENEKANGMFAGHGGCGAGGYWFVKN
jgi:hypothetical protein